MHKRRSFRTVALYLMAYGFVRQYQDGSFRSESVTSQIGATAMSMTMLKHFRAMFPQANWAKRHFNVPLVETMAGIFEPSPEIGSEKIGLTKQFLADAEIYDAQYDHAHRMVELLTRSFEYVGYPKERKITILDLGAGSGKNSILPALALFPDARFVATDLSPDLLGILRRHVVREKLESQIACICTDATRNYFVANSFNVVLGVSILHHLLDPVEALKAAYGALKKGGIAIFYEPFEGFCLIGLAFQNISKQSVYETEKLDASVADFLNAMVFDLETRRGIDKSGGHFRHMDDKWLFTRSHVEYLADLTGFKTTKIIARTKHTSSFRDHVLDLLRLGIGRTEDALPAWAWAHVDILDQSFSSEMKNDLVMEGAVILVK